VAKKCIYGHKSAYIRTSHSTIKLISLFTIDPDTGRTTSFSPFSCFTGLKMLLQNLYAVQMQLPYPWESAAALFYNHFGSIFTGNPDIFIGFFEGQPLSAKFQHIYLYT
jgi:hypothetical protein